MLRILKKLILTMLFAVFASQASAMFIQADWFDPTEPGVGTNRYAYSGNDPINQSDPSGNAFHDWGMDQQEADADNQRRADDFYNEANRIRNSDRLVDRVRDFLGIDTQSERSGDHYQSRVGVSNYDRIRRDIGDVAAAGMMGIRPSGGAALGVPKTAPRTGPVGVVAGRHNANIIIRNANGEIVTHTRLVSGNQTAAEKAMGFPKGSLASHTEARAVTQYGMKSGDKMVITGQKAPCPSCKGYMNRAARHSGASVTYQWRSNGATQSWTTKP